ncbi:hypothetical protein [Sorangium sp. So ce1097]|uniref:hypothetical protein n=1 Tax=Sorangium sp. So ce1097 TaxID=3133330 RepID=UPI003F5FBFD7
MSEAALAIPVEPLTSLGQALQAAQSDLSGRDPGPFSEGAYLILREATSQYVTDVAFLSADLAKREQADVISASHIRRATEFLVSNPRRRYAKHLGTVGGILLGASLSQVLAMLQANQFTIWPVVGSALLGIVGSFLVAIQVVRE